MSASNRSRLKAGVVEAEARAGLPEAVRLEPDLADPLEQVRVAVLRRLRAELLEVGHLEQALEVLVEVLAEEVLVDRVEAVAEPTRSSIPRMAKFPTRRRPARSPTT